MDLQEKLHSCAELMEYIKEVGFLPLLPLGIRGWSAEEVMDEDSQYVKLPDFCNYRRSVYPYPEEGSIEEAILETLKLNGSMITRDLRKACGFTQPKMRSKFDTYISRLQMGGYIVTEDFVYPHDKHGRQYGWGWSLLNTPESLFGREACHINRSPEESKQRLVSHLSKIIPGCNEESCALILDKFS